MRVNLIKFAGKFKILRVKYDFRVNLINFAGKFKYTPLNIKHYVINKNKTFQFEKKISICFDTYLQNIFQECLLAIKSLILFIDNNFLF